MKKTHMMIVVFLFSSSYLTGYVSAQNAYSVSFEIWDTWTADVSGDSAENKNYIFRKEINFGVCERMPGGATEGVREFRISFRPLNSSILLNSWGFTFNGEAYETGWQSIVDVDCFNAGINSDIDQEMLLPMTVNKSVDNVFFDSPGMQKVTVVVVPQSSSLNMLEVEFRTGSTDEAGVRLASIPDSLTEDGEMAFYFIENPRIGVPYTVTLEQEITPKKGQVSYVPEVRVMTGSQKRNPPITNDSYILKTDFGIAMLEATDDVIIYPSVNENFGINFKGITTTAEIRLVNSQDVSGTGEIPGAPGTLGATETSETSGIPWWIIAVAFAPLAVVLVVFFGRKKLRLQGKPKPPEDSLQSLTKEEKHIRSVKKNVQREYFKGVITEEAFNKLSMEYQQKLLIVITKKEELQKKKK